VPGSSWGLGRINSRRRIHALEVSSSSPPSGISYAFGTPNGERRRFANASRLNGGNPRTALDSPSPHLPTTP
jgi:hypothetical protein